MARKRPASDSGPQAKQKKQKSLKDEKASEMADDSEKPRVTFMDLPVEIRTEIYGHVFAENRPVSLRMRHKNNNGPREVWRWGAGRHPGKVYSKFTKKWEPAPLKHISILFASRQVFAEAEPVLYGCKIFQFDTTTGLTEFIDRIGSRAEHIRHVQFTSGAYKKSTARAALSALSVAKGLRKLVFAYGTLCPSPYSSHVAQTPERLAQDCKALMKSLEKYRTE